MALIRITAALVGLIGLYPAAMRDAMDTVAQRLGTILAPSAKRELTAAGARAIPALSKVVASGTTPARLDAIEVLSSEKDFQAIIPLAKCLTDPGVAVRQPASDAIDLILHPPTGDWLYIGEAEYRNGRPVPAFLKDLSHEQFEALMWGPFRVRVLNDSRSADSKIRRKLVEDIAGAEDSLDIPDSVVISRDFIQPHWSCPADIVVRHCEPEMLEVLDDPISTGRASLIDILAKLKNRDLYLRLDGFCKNANTWVRRSAYLALQYYPGAHSSALLLQGVRDRSAEVRIQSLLTLDKFDPHLAGKEAIRMLDEPIKTERDFVAETLVWTKSPELIDDLIPLPTSRDERSRFTAFQALASIGGNRVDSVLEASVLDPNSPDRLMALDAMSRGKREEFGEFAMNYLSDANPEFARTACEVVVHLHETRALPALRGLSGSVNAKVAAMAKWALGELGDNIKSNRS